MQQATLAIRAHVPVDVLGDTIQPFPSFFGIADTAVKTLQMEIAGHAAAGPADGRPGGEPFGEEAAH